MSKQCDNLNCQSCGLICLKQISDVIHTTWYSHDWDHYLYCTAIIIHTISCATNWLFKSNHREFSLQVIHWSTHWGRVTHICVSKLTITGLDNGLSLGRHQAIIWTNAGILLIGPLGINFSEILIEIQTFWFIQENALQNVICKMVSVFLASMC